MRPSLIPSLLEVAEINVKHQERFRLFELGRAYTADEKNFSKEGLHLGAAFYDKESNPFIEMTNVVSNLLSSLNLAFDFVPTNPKFPNPLVPAEWLGTHPYEFTNIRIMGKLSGIIFSVHPLILRNLKIKGHLTLCLFDLSIFENFKTKDKIKYKPLSKFPISTFDWTVVATKDQSVVDVIGAARKTKLKELQAIEMLDLFESGNQKFITLRATLGDENGTLTSEFLKGAEALLIDGTTKSGFSLK
jgi:phenylalanyl-tRNA synthetase beta chain